jgi:hypothetical protein
MRISPRASLPLAAPRRHGGVVKRVLAVAVVLVAMGVVAPSAFAAHAWWRVVVAPTSTHLTPGTVARIDVTVYDAGDAPIEAATQPVRIATKLPSWLVPTEVLDSRGEPASAVSGGIGGGYDVAGALQCETATVTCTFTNSDLAGGLTEAEAGPFLPLQVIIFVKVEADAPSSGGVVETTVEGGEAQRAHTSQQLSISSEPNVFGVEKYSLSAESEDGSPDTQAGSHPFQLTTLLGLNQTLEEGGNDFLPLVSTAPAALRDVRVHLPAGLVGNATALPQCSEVDFVSLANSAINLCPADTVVGAAVTTLNEPLHLYFTTVPTPIFNLVPAPGEPARFGYLIEGVPVVLDTAVRTGSNYAVTVNVTNISEVAGVLDSSVTFWGVPGSSIHNASRGWACIAGAYYVHLYGVHGESCERGESSPKPFLTLPTSCPAGPLQSSVEVDSWKEPKPEGQGIPATSLMPSLDGCNEVPFQASIEAAPDVESASSPTGLKVNVHVPQQTTANPEGTSGSDVKDIQVTLPEGVTLNPSGANNLEACSEGLVGYEPGSSSPPEELSFTPRKPGSINAVADGETEAFKQGINFCPDASKIGTVNISTPLLPSVQHLTGSVYLASQNENPFGSLIAMYIVAEDPVSGVLVKLPGEVKLNPSSGRIEALIRNSPQLPFENATLEFFGGERAPLSTPTRCGTYTTNASFTPWSGQDSVISESSFNITSGPNHSACPGSALPFSPSLTGGMTNINAGAFSPLTTTIGREDGQQNINQVQLKMPAGLSGILSGVPLCGEAEANAGTCSSASQIGSTIVSVGLGGDPYSVTGGKVYLTGPYQGAPFGLSIVNPAVAGPFNLGNVVVRAKIEVNPTTAALTITTNTEAEGYAIPHILQGIPLQIKHINVTIERAGFTFNPTNCTPASITGSVGSFEGASSAVSVPFQVTNCATLKFAPKFTVSTPGHTSKVDGAGLTAKLSYPAAAQGTQADIKAVKVDLPKQLPSRLTTLQKACTAKQFETNPANCPKASKIGFAKVSTPLLPVPLEGPAIFVSHGGEAFPSLTMVLQGYGVTVDLVGTTYISHAGITSTTFKTVPDVPFNTFELTLGQGPYSALAANLPTKDKGSFCGQTLSMPTAFVAQNGLEIHESTKLSVSGCPKVKKAKAKKKSNKKKK